MSDSPRASNTEGQSPANQAQGSRVLERQARLIAEFTAMPDWESRYKRLIERGKKLESLPVEFQDEKYKVRGCQSQVWLHARLLPDQTIEFRADSDAMIVKGLVALLVEVYSHASPEEILGSTPQFLKDLGFESHLSPSRANGLYAMVKQIMYYATAFQAALKAGVKI
jgi:cysteine desulfuration protein SufE